MAAVWVSGVLLGGCPTLADPTTDDLAPTTPTSDSGTETTPVVCQGLFAAALAEQYGLHDCATEGVPCRRDGTDASCTPNEFLDLVYADPDGQTVQGTKDRPSDVVDATKAMIGVPYPRCVDGTDDCPASEQLRCVDGTRPFFHIALPDALPAEPKWFFAYQGGGSCAGMERDGEFVPSAATCAMAYEVERPEMSDWELRVGQTGDEARVGPPLSLTTGGLFRDTRANYRDHVRIRTSKCSFDRGTGRARRDVFSFEGVDYEIDRAGFLLTRGLLAYLATGPTVRDWRTGDDVTLPALGDASQVVFLGHSGGADGLQSTLDGLATLTAEWAPAADVRGVFDARGWPGFDAVVASHHGTDGLYSTNVGPLPECSGDEAASDWCGTVLGMLPEGTDEAGSATETSAITAERWQSSGGAVVQQLEWNAVRDTSCLEVLPEDEHGRCSQGMHVMFNHTSTPFFLRQAARDSKHLNSAPRFAVNKDYRWRGNSYEQLVIDQALDFVAEREPSLRRYRDPDGYAWTRHDAGSPDLRPGVGVFVADTGLHAGIFSNEGFTGPDAEAECEDGVVTYGQALWRWLEGEGDQICITDDGPRLP